MYLMLKYIKQRI